MKRSILFCGLVMVACNSSWLQAATPLPTAITALEAPAPGGAPYISIGGKSGGELSRKAWDGLVALELKGCVAKPVIATTTLSYTDTSGKTITRMGKGAQFTAQQKAFISQLPSRTRFTVSVEAYDGGQKLDLRAAVFTIVG